MRIGFTGGDSRMRVLADAALADGHTVASLAPLGVGVGVADIEALCRFSKVVVLPVPSTRDGVHLSGTTLPLSSLPLSERHAVFGGFLPPSFHPCERLLDIAHDERTVYKNAVLTAEGAIASLLTATGCGLLGLSVGVVGFGRIARSLVYRIRGFGVPITVYARRPEALAEAESLGCRAVPLAPSLTLAEDVILGTVPAPIYGGLRVGRPVYLTDLGGGMPASLPGEGGEAFPVTSARGVPGVFAPRGAGLVLWEALRAFLDTL